ncbi:hypothetical protein [Salinisphaera sp. G21_0]|uniref:hypothetical protein n=1 Tax=Salinisphaera sp. G21_0 TaxID=2821094 RepID=UPI001ADAD8C2|nr:hypothetical protein [Salinisphaera sp. G21_0]MBO9480675.1 hypothetical protein [Salinisphaera sp. G21_0]
MSSDKTNGPEYSQPSDFSLTKRQTATIKVDETYHTPELTSASDQSLPEPSSASCPVSDVFMKPLPDDNSVERTLPDFCIPSSPQRITIGSVRNFKEVLSNHSAELEQEFLNRKFLDTDHHQFHSLIYNRLVSLRCLADKYLVFRDNAYQLVDWYNKKKFPFKSQYIEFSEQLFLSDDMCEVTLRLAMQYRVLIKMLCQWYPGDDSPDQQAISFLSEYIACHLSFVRCVVEKLIRGADIRDNIALRAPVKPQIRNYHSILHVPPRKRPGFNPKESDMLKEGISDMLTAIATGAWEDFKSKEPILHIVSDYLFQSIDRYRQESGDHEFQPVCVTNQTIGQHLFCADLIHAASIAGRWDETKKACEATTRIVFHNQYSLEPVIQALKHNNTAGINIESWHSELNEHRQSRYYPLSYYFIKGLVAASIYLSNLIDHKEDETENQSLLIPVEKTEYLQKTLDVLNRWGDQLHELDLLPDEAMKDCTFYRRLPLVRKRIQTLTNNHEMTIRNSFDEAKKIIVQYTAGDGITNDNPQPLSECLKPFLARPLIQNHDILKLINKECDAYNPGINISELDRTSCEWLTNIFANHAPSPHTELLLTFSQCSYYCVVLIEQICECASIFSDLEACLTSIYTSDSSHAPKMRKEKWNEKIKANASGIKEKTDQFHRFNQNIKSSFKDAFSHLNKIREHVINEQDKCLKIVMFESIHATLYHSLQQIKHLNDALVTVISKRVDILNNEFPTIAKLEQASACNRKRLKKNIAFIAGCLKDLNISKELSLAKTTISHKPNPVPTNNGRSKKQTSKNRNTLANFVTNNNKSVRLDTPKTLTARDYFHEQIAKGVQALNHDGKPVAYLGSRAYQVQVQSLWGSEAFKQATSSDLLPAEILPGVIQRSVTPRDTDLLVLNREDFSSIKDQLYDWLKEAAKEEGGFLPDEYEPVKTNDFNEVYYGINCCFCNLILRLKGTYTRKDWIYVVDLITPMESGPSTLLNYDSPVLASGDSTHARSLTSIMIDELNLAIGQAVGPARALMAMTRINVLAVLEYLEPKLDSVPRIVLMHVLERLQNSYPDPAQGKLASNLRSRAFNMVAHEGSNDTN